MELIMGQPIPLRDDFSSRDLRMLARVSTDADQVRRLLAMAAILDGASRGEAAKNAFCDVQTLRDWVIRFNREGPDGLIDCPKGGRPPRLADEQKRKLAIMIEMGPELFFQELARWRLCDLKQLIKEHFGVDVCEMTISNYMKELGFSWISARPRHPRQDERAIEDFKKNF